MKIPAWSSHIGRALNQNSPSILSAVSIGGVIATAYLTARATLKAEKRCDEFLSMKWTPKDRVEECWKFYIPPALAAASTIACIIGAHQIGSRRQAAYLGAYTLADAAFREYKDEVIKQVGTSKERKVNDAIAEKHLQDNPVRDDQIIITQGGDSLCYDDLTGRYFKSDIESIRQNANDINALIIQDMFASLNEFYERLGLAHCDIGDYLGFNLDNFVEVRFSSHLAQNGQPCLAMAFERAPRPNYSKF
jgi:hypothetical protein